VVNEVGAVQILDAHVDAELRNADLDVIFIHVTHALEEDLAATPKTVTRVIGLTRGARAHILLKTQEHPSSSTTLAYAFQHIGSLHPHQSKQVHRASTRAATKVSAHT
jgi:hypothetical protein